MAPLAVNGVAGAGLSKEQRYELQELEKIMKLKDLVYNGSHPRVKIPAHLVSKQIHAPSTTVSAPLGPARASNLNSSPPQQTTTSNNVQPTSTATQQMIGRTVKNYNDDIEMGDTASVSSSTIGNAARKLLHGQTGTLNEANATSKPEMNTIFLKQFGHLTAEQIKAKRQQLERTLVEGLEQQAKDLYSVDKLYAHLGGFLDVGEAFTRALALINNGAVNFGATQNATASPNDSFGNSTFYSSEFETPDQRKSSLGRPEPGEILSRPASAHIQEGKVAQSPLPGRILIPSANPSSSHSSTILPSQNLPGLHQLPQRREIDTSFASPLPNRSRSVMSIRSENTQQQGATRVFAQDNTRRASGVQNAQDSGGAMVVDVDEPVQGHAGQTPQQTGGAQRRSNTIEEPGSIITNNLSPVAPQPVRLSPLATAKGPLLAQHDSILQSSLVTPLPARNEQNASVEGATALSNRKRKQSDDEGRTSGDLNASGRNSSDTVFIKREPLSNSPTMPTSLPRPNKRPRQTLQQSGGLDYDEPAFEEPRQHAPHNNRSRNGRGKGKGRGNGRQQYESRNRNVETRAIDLEESDNRQYLTEPRRDQSQQLIPRRDMDGAPTSARPKAMYTGFDERVPSSINVDDRHVSPVSPGYRGTQTVLTGPEFNVEAPFSPLRARRSSVMMAPPPRMRERIVIDEYGNQFVEQVQVVPRQAVLPQSRIVEPYYVDEMPPPRRVVRTVQAPLYDDDYVVETQERSYVQPRRVISVPDYQFEAPSYRQREFSTVPVQRSQMGDYRDDPAAEAQHRAYSSRPVQVIRAPPADEYSRHEEDSFARPMQPPPRQVVYVDQPQIIRVGSVRPEAVRPAYTRASTRAPSVFVDSSRRVVSGRDINGDDGDEPVGAAQTHREPMAMRAQSVRPREGEQIRQEYERRRPIGYEEVIQTPDGRQMLRFVPADQMDQMYHQDEVPYVPRRQVQQIQQIQQGHQAQQGQQIQRDMYDEEVPRRVYR